MAESLNATQILAAAGQQLTQNGYVEIAPAGFDSAAARIFEDAFGIVEIHVYDTWRQLANQWFVAQGHLVELISDHLRRADAKAWEGYLVLLTPGLISGKDRIALTELRNNTNRVRKLVATGHELATLSDIRTALLPLLPLSNDNSESKTDSSLLGLLPGLLLESEVPRAVTEAIIDAFLDNESILERLHALNGEK